jgi:hypothetical protein
MGSAQRLASVQNGLGRWPQIDRRTPRHELRQIRRRMVYEAAKHGIPTTVIAKLAGVANDTLYRRYRPELQAGIAEAHGAIAGKAYQVAMDGDVQMLKFWLSCQLGWKPPAQEITTPPGLPFEVSPVMQRVARLLGDEKAIEGQLEP